MSSLNPLRVFILTKMCGYCHDSSHALCALITSFPALDVYVSDDSSELLYDGKFDAIILAHNTGQFLLDEEVEALNRFVEIGGGVLGIHAASSGMASSEVYREIIGATFDGHPEPQWGLLTLECKSHYITRALSLPDVSSAPRHALDNPPRFASTKPNSFVWFDEWYNFKTLPRERSDLQILLSVDESTYTGGQHPEYHPLMWCHELGNGRVVYTSLGHFDEAYQDGWFSETLRRGLEWIAKRDGI